MTAPALPDLAPAPDPALPGLAAVLSARPPGTAADERCRLRSVDWVPHRRCRVVQEVRGPGRTTLLTYEVTPRGTTVSEPADDPGLPGLAAALDPAGVAGRLSDLCLAPVTACTVTPVAHRAGSRAVVACDVVAGGAPARFYAKLLAEGPDRYAAATAAISTTARERDVPVPVPEVVAVWPDLGAVVQRAVPGRGLSETLRDPALTQAGVLRHAERLGRLLAGVHTTPCGTVPPWGPEDELAALETLLVPAWHADPSAGRSLAALVDRLADELPAAADPVLAHGAFRTGQVVVDGGTLTLLDLDTVSASDPERDAGNAAGYLEWAEVRGALPPGSAAALGTALATGYAEDRTALDAQPLAWWSTVAMAKIAGRRFRSLATAEWPRVPELLRRAGARLDPAGLVPTPRSPVLDLGAARLPGVGPEGVRTLAEAGGRRRVVRYEVQGLDPDRAVPVVAKTYADRHRSSTAHANLVALGEVFAATPHLAVPVPVGHLPTLRTVLYREVPGTPLDRLAGRDAATAAGLAGGWLATLHGSAAALGRRLDLSHEVADAALWASCVAETVPGARDAALALAARLAAAAADLPGTPDVPVHKDFHAGHVLTAPGASGVAVIDLDEARMGDPACDVAHFTAYLDAFPASWASGVRAAFLAGYGPLPGPSPAARTAFFTAYTDLKIAKQLVTGRGPLVGRPGAAGAAALTAVLRRGLTCLDG